MRGKDEHGSEPHVLIFPLPAQGNVNPMLQLAELLALSDVHVTFLNTHHIHGRFLHFTADNEARYPTLRFETFADGVPDNNPRFGGDMNEFFNHVKFNGALKLRELCSEQPGKLRITCIIGDGIFGDITSDIGDDLGIPIIHFRTTSACCFWSYFSVPKLLQSNEIHIRGEEDMDRIITEIPGMGNLIRFRDLPSSFRGDRNGHIPLEALVFQTNQTLRAKAMILNTFEDLEGPVLSQIRLNFPKLYNLGPLHTHLNFRRASKTASYKESVPSSKSSLWEVDRSCMAWLDAQPPKSVLYVSFGSITTISREELIEIWYGLVNSKKRFLWVIRPDMVTERDGKDLPSELVEGTKERGCTVPWAPQLEVLAHKAVGGFLTHSGWNSTLESVVAGVPMICWPYFADQQINSRYVSEVWKIGLDMKDTCDRKIVEKMVNDLMVERREEFQKSAETMAAVAKASVREGVGQISYYPMEQARYHVAKWTQLSGFLLRIIIVITLHR